MSGEEADTSRKSLGTEREPHPAEPQQIAEAEAEAAGQGPPEEEEQGGREEEESSEESETEEEDHTQGNQPDPNMAQQQHQAATGSQLATIEAFDGKEGLEIRNFCTAVDRAKKQFRWSEEQTVTAAQFRMQGQAQTWLRGQSEMMGKSWDTWDAFRKQLLERFSPVINSAMAVEAVKDLKQRHSETVSEFYDRLLHALDRKNHAISEADKALDAYKKALNQDLKTFFLGGLKDNTQKKIMGKEEIPEKPEDCLKIAKAIEAADNHQHVAIIQEARGKGEQKGFTVEENFRGPKRGPQCYACQGWGHYARECPSKLRQMQRGGGRGASRGASSQRGGSSQRGSENGRGFRRGGRRGSSSGRGGRGRGWRSHQNEVNYEEEDQPEPEPHQYEEHEEEWQPEN